MRRSRSQLFLWLGLTVLVCSQLIFWIGKTNVQAASAQRIVVKNASGSIIGYIEGEVVKDKSGKLLGKVRDGKTYDASGSLVATPEVPGLLLCGHR